MKWANINCLKSSFLYSAEPLTSLMGEISDSEILQASKIVSSSISFPLRNLQTSFKYSGVGATPPVDMLTFSIMFELVLM